MAHQPLFGNVVDIVHVWHSDSKVIRKAARQQVCRLRRANKSCTFSMVRVGGKVYVTETRVATLGDFIC